MIGTGIGDVREVEVVIGIERGRGVEVGVVDGNLEGNERSGFTGFVRLYDALGCLSAKKNLA